MAEMARRLTTHHTQLNGIAECLNQMLRQVLLGISHIYVSRFCLSNASASLSSHHKKGHFWHPKLIDMTSFYHYRVAEFLNF